jgi:hypothetical protein
MPLRLCYRIGLNDGPMVQAFFESKTNSGEAGTALFQVDAWRKIGCSPKLSVRAVTAILARRWIGRPRVFRRDWYRRSAASR